MNPDRRDPAAIDRYRELAAGRALGDLSDAERAELGRLQSVLPEETAREEAWSLDLAAAALELALDLPDVAPLPAHLADRVEARAREHFSQPRPVVPDAPVTRGRPDRPWLKLAAWSGWLTAAAAGLLAAWLSWRAPVPVIAPPSPPVAGGAAPESPEPRLERLVASVPPLTLKATDHPLARGAGGMLVWDPRRQEGYLRLTGLAEVAATQGVYQLWIFDRTRDDRYPILGSTFTIADASRPSVIPIRPDLKVREPVQYAITLEPPGGVVVSDRQRILLVARSDRGG